MEDLNSDRETAFSGFLQIFYRFLIIFLVVLIFIPSLNPAHVSELVGKTQSLLSSGLSYGKLTHEFVRPLAKGWVSRSSLNRLYWGSLFCWVGVLVSALGACMSLGQTKLKRLGFSTSLFGSLFSLIFSSFFFLVFNAFSRSTNVSKVQPVFPSGLIWFIALNGIVLAVSLILLLTAPRTKPGEGYHMDDKYRLFLMLMPFLALTFIFAYLPLWGWAVAFFDYKAGFDMTMDRFVGFKWFTYLLGNEATRADILRVMKNTLAMSGLGLATSWCAMAFAIFLMEMRNVRVRRIVQTLTTIPNFISWVLVYSVALAIFSSQGFLNSILSDLKIIQAPIQFLQSPDHIWLKMLAWGMWKGLGWNAIIYIAAITGIDPQLYEAATVDGAGRFGKIWHITIPSLMPTFFVLLLLAIAGILSNGMEQYLVFKNPMNKSTIEVLDLYVYVIGLGSGGGSNIPLATVIGLLKSVLSVTLLFGANRASKLIRGESIV